MYILFIEKYFRSFSKNWAYKASIFRVIVIKINFTISISEKIRLKHDGIKISIKFFIENSITSSGIRKLIK